MIGNAVDAAAMNYDKPNWAGIHCESSVDDDIKSVLTSIDINHSKLCLIKYKVPYKGYRLEKYVINWPYELEYEPDKLFQIEKPSIFVEDVLKFCLAQVSTEDIVERARIVEKYENIKEFYSFGLHSRKDMLLR